MRIKDFVRIGAAFALLAGTAAVSANEGGHAGWERAAENEVANLPSLQRGARNFLNYCSGCHSLKYIRYSRVATDLKISDEQRDAFLVRPGDKFSDYIKTSLPEKDAIEWFGKAPPDLSLVTRSRGSDWVFNFLTTFYADPASRQTGVNNLQLPGTAMPHVLASLQGVQGIKTKDVERRPVPTASPSRRQNSRRSSRASSAASRRRSTTSSCATPSTSCNTSATLHRSNGRVSASGSCCSC